MKARTASSDNKEELIRKSERKQTKTRNFRRNQLLIFRNVEEILETFNSDNKVNVIRWIKDFEEIVYINNLVSKK